MRYQGLLAERRYKAVDPDNRVVARTLEREWEEKLREVERVEREFEETLRRERVVLDDEDRARILARARDLEGVWKAQTTSPVQRKNLLRILVREVCLSPIDVPERCTRIRVLWVTNAVSEIDVARVDKKKAHQTTQIAVECIRTMLVEGHSATDIAENLNRRGLRTGMGRAWDARAVERARRRHRLAYPTPQRKPLDIRSDGLFSVAGVAARIGVTPAVVHHWIVRGLLTPVVPGGPGRAAWYRLDEETCERLVKAKKTGHRRACPQNLDD